MELCIVCYGPRQDPHGEAGVVAILTQRLLRGQDAIIFGDGSVVRDFIYVSDVARACCLAIGADLSSGFFAFNISTGRGTRILDLATSLRDCCRAWLKEHGDGRSIPPLRFGPARPGDLRESVLDSERAARLLGWRAEVPLHQGLRQTVDWFGSLLHGEVVTRTMPPPTRNLVPFDPLPRFEESRPIFPGAVPTTLTFRDVQPV